MSNRGGISLYTAALVVVLVVILWAAAGFGVLSTATEASRRAVCMNNLRQIEVAVALYADDHEGRLPPSFGLLLKEGRIPTQKDLICPSGCEQTRKDFPEDAKAADLATLERVAEFGSYVLAAGSSMDRPTDWIIVYEKDGAHDGLGRNIGYRDGVVRWMPEGEFQVTMQKQEAVRRGITPPALGPAAEADGGDPVALANTVAAWAFVALAAAGLVGMMVRQKRVNVVFGWREGGFVLAYVMAIAGWVVLIGYMGHSLQAARTRENRARLVGFAATRYAWDHGGAYPAKLSALLEEGYVTRPGPLVDSGWSLPAGRPYPPGVLAAVADGGPYAPVPGVHHSGRADVLVLYELRSWAPRWCYFDDGHLERLSASELRKRLP
jgi:hypothetical protein